jgi:hypothetical protein
LPIPPMFSASWAYLIRLCGERKALRNTLFLPEILDLVQARP